MVSASACRRLAACACWHVAGRRDESVFRLKSAVVEGGSTQRLSTIVPGVRVRPDWHQSDACGRCVVHVMKIDTLKRKAQFKRVRGGARWVGPLFVIEGRRRLEATGDGAPAPVGHPAPRFGFTITRKVGGAVIRNRIRRRLKEAIRSLSPTLMRADHDYVVVASRAVHDYPFAGLQDALREAFERLREHKVGGQRRVIQRKRPPAGQETARAAPKRLVETVHAAGTEVGPEPVSDADETRPGTTPGRR